MTAINILIFVFAFLLAVLTMLFFLVRSSNKKNLVVTERFLSHSSKFNPSLLRDIKLRYWTTNATRTMISPNNYCDIYLFDNFLAIVRRQNFIFNVFFAPVLITSDIINTKNNFSDIAVYKPDRINFNQVMKNEIDIKLKDPVYNHYKIDITFKGLSGEQLTQLTKIRNWC